MKHLNYSYKEDSLAEESIEVALILPKETDRSMRKDIWIQKTFLGKSRLFYDQVYEYKKYFESTALVAKTYDLENNGYRLTDQNGNVVESSELLNLIFTPKAWMTDNIQERSMMYNTAKISKGKVLAAGLGLGVYLQFCLHLNNDSITEITVVEKSEKVIDLIVPNLLLKLGDKAKKIKIVHDSFENFIVNTKEKYDTIYIDIHGDVHLKFLPFLNHLVYLSENNITDNGQIFVWGYEIMLNSYIAVALELENTFKKEFNDKTHIGLNPEYEIIFREYTTWRQSLTEVPSQEEIRKKADEFAFKVETSECEDILSAESRFQRHMTILKDSENESEKKNEEQI